MGSSSLQIRTTQRTGSRFQTAVILSGMAVLMALALHFLPSSLVSWDTVPFLVAGCVLSIALFVALGYGRTRDSHVKRVGFVIWWFLLISEELFLRWTSETGENAFEGHFSFAAYAEAAFWVLAFIALLIAALARPQYLRGSFSGNSKWVSFFALFCLFSGLYSPRPTFSLVWAFKLGLVVFLLRMCVSQLFNVADVTGFLRATFWGFAFLNIEQGLRILMDPSASAFERFTGAISPTGLAGTAGILLLLSLTLYSLTARKWLFLFGGTGLMLMILAAGKTAIAAALFSGTLFFVLQKRLSAAVGFVAGVFAVGVLAVLFTPLGSYLHTYGDSGTLGTFSGRTDLWNLAVPAILRHPLIGHGYMSSKFLTVQVAGIPWAAGHMHNGFLEILYNNGVLGLILFLPLIAIAFRNLIRVIRTTPLERPVHKVAVGCLALFVFLLINGMFNASFGGRPDSPFEIFLALVIISDKLFEMALYPVSLNRVQTPEFGWAR